MNKYCCFFCPAKDRSLKSLTDICPTCGRTYGFPLENAPTHIDRYRVIKPLGRGFYGAAYVAENAVGKKFVLKITPQGFYTYFEKASFKEEVSLHVKVAENAGHVVDIIEATDNIPITFTDSDNTKLNSCLTVLNYVDGDILKDYIEGKIEASASTICQIAIDLLRISEEFAANTVNHNDLHDGNLIVENLRPTLRRADAIDNTIKVKAIDLGSISDESKSGDDRYGDLHFIAKHVDSLLVRLLSNPQLRDDRDYRIALSLQAVVSGLQSNIQNLRIPNIDDIIKPIIDAYNSAAHPWRPWRSPLTLRGFADHYNAQTLESWDVPKLIVDPDNRWIHEITKQGPQIITGMRGCGKTMLLRSLDFHARASNNDGETPEQILGRIKSDGYVGLFVSAQRLLSLRSQSLLKLENRLSKLFISYALQATRALLHLKDISPNSIKIGAHSDLANAIVAILEGADELKLVSTIEDLEHRLTNILVLSIRDLNKFSVKAAPSEAFGYLSRSLCDCSEVFSNSSVFFLLDDVSSRYLDIDNVGELLSALLFQNPKCAFKFTSEWQTVELGLKSPGREHPVREGRDISVFDLGADVFETLKSAGNKGKDFVANILQQRAKIHSSHPRVTPKDILGDVTLEQIALDIASTSDNSEKKKNVYRGLSCLTKVCVGDIGDVIKLYEEMIRQAPANFTPPISSSIQSNCFRGLSSRRIYDLNRRKGYFKDHAIAFSEVAHELLVRSYKESIKEGRTKIRLRQYSSIYVKMTTEDPNSLKEQIDRLRELIDASVFVFTGSSPRAKTQDSNPIQQFILSFRKIYGLNAFIGLSDRDRFELSGNDLEEWLNNPAHAKEILLRNQLLQDLDGVDTDSEEEFDKIILLDSESEISSNESYRQGLLFETINKIEIADNAVVTCPNKINISISSIGEGELQHIKLDAVLTGLGFEERTYHSNKFLSMVTKPNVVHAIRYSLSGYADSIIDCWTASGSKLQEIFYSTPNITFPEVEGTVLLDISGLSKPLIYRTIQRELSKKGRILVCHAAAKEYYPLQEDLKHLFSCEQNNNDFLERLANVLMGERGPYSDIKLIDEKFDPTRSRALIAFASPKHERLFSLLDKREYDYIQIITPSEETPRASVSAYAADFLSQNYPNTTVSKISTDDLKSLVSNLDDYYLELYSNAGANVEIGLTGSKTQAVAAAILSSQRKVAQVWYLSPQEFDEKRFSFGVGPVTIYDIKLPDLSSVCNK